MTFLLLLYKSSWSLNSKDFFIWIHFILLMGLAITTLKYLSKYILSSEFSLSEHGCQILVLLCLFIACFN